MAKARDIKIGSFVQNPYYGVGKVVVVRGISCGVDYKKHGTKKEAMYNLKIITEEKYNSD